MTNELQILTNLGSNAVQSAITEYTHWHFVNALVWVLMGILLIFAAIKIYRSEFMPDDIKDNKYLICPLLLALGVLIVGLNINNLICPRAYSIHQLILDVRGK